MKIRISILSTMVFLLSSYAFASQEFLAINGAAKSLGGSLYSVSGEVVDVSAGLDLGDAKKVALEQIKLAVPPHLDIDGCAEGKGAFLVGSNGGDVFQLAGPLEINGDKNILVLYDFICSKDVVPDGKPSPFSH